MIHTYIHTYIHTCIHTYIHTCIHTCIHTNIQTYIHTYIHAYKHTYIHTHTHTHIHSNKYTRGLFHTQRVPIAGDLIALVQSTATTYVNCANLLGASEGSPRPYVWHDSSYTCHTYKTRIRFIYICISYTCEMTVTPRTLIAPICFLCVKSYLFACHDSFNEHTYVNCAHAAGAKLRQHDKHNYVIVHIQLLAGKATRIFLTK